MRSEGGEVRVRVKVRGYEIVGEIECFTNMLQHGHEAATSPNPNPGSGGGH